jgi:predicted RNA-binding Zn ribbon-like protein
VLYVAFRSEAHIFRPADYVGGHPVVDFVNTVTARNAEPVDWIGSYNALLRWAEMSPAFAGVELPDPGSLAPSACAGELAQCTDLREAVYSILVGIVQGRSAGSAPAVLERHWRQSASQSSVDLTQAPAKISHADGSPLTTVRRTLAFAAVELLTTLSPQRLRLCAGPRCGWVFLDTSKAGQRRWCDMATCGTAHKNRQRARTKREPRPGC